MTIPRSGSSQEVTGANEQNLVRRTLSITPWPPYNVTRRVPRGHIWLHQASGNGPLDALCPPPTVCTVRKYKGESRVCNRLQIPATRYSFRPFRGGGRAARLSFRRHAAVLETLQITRPQAADFARPAFAVAHVRKAHFLNQFPDGRPLSMSCESPEDFSNRRPLAESGLNHRRTMLSLKGVVSPFLVQERHWATSL